jgi:hypothetical protein
MRPRHSFLKIARLRGTSVERVGFGRSDLSFIPFYSVAEPLRFPSANLPTAKGKTTNSNFLGGNSRLAFCHDRSKMMFAFRYVKPFKI